MTASLFDHDVAGLDPDVHGRLLCLAELDLRPDFLGKLLRQKGLDGVWTYFTNPSQPPDEQPAVPLQRFQELRTQLLRARPDVTAMRHQKAGLQVLGLGMHDYPERLATRPKSSGVIIARGSVELLRAPKIVAIVGTRRASSYGRQVAKQLGIDLAEANVHVVSGLARGIDGAAHEGVIGTRSKEADRARPLGAPVGVIAHGHDHVYPASHRALFSQVAQTGVLLSERPLGVRPLPIFFPQRNQVIAGLADVLVIVESAMSGGSMISARLADKAGIEVLAVPGSILSEGSDGCNALLNDGVAPCRGASDVIDALNNVERRKRKGRASAFLVDPRPTPNDNGALILRALAWDVLSVETLLARCPAFTSARLVLELHELEFDGWVGRGSDGWFQRAPL